LKIGASTTFAAPREWPDAAGQCRRRRSVGPQRRCWRRCHGAVAPVRRLAASRLSPSFYRHRSSPPPQPSHAGAALWHRQPL